MRQQLLYTRQKVLESKFISLHFMFFLIYLVFRVGLLFYVLHIL